ncbi:Type 1 phosphatases regulator YPI1 [Hypsizygus marmoreus]|uniref:Type 1 phosphatases regulator n=1 Tax=Hypsizygus marmoreus TaxID=39966 RepID=A0A369K9Q8_HYPMA|nr:Type 1 phosphatases regulator YPI1 [Hypsizygus marmoreus]
MADASRTVTITNSDTASPDGIVGTLRLRGSRSPSQSRVAWDEDVVDNEGCGRKSSKVCCIYHKPRKFDESSSEESSDSDSDASHDHHHPRRRRGRPHTHGSPGAPDGASSQREPDQPVATMQDVEHEPERNAYETEPHSKKGKGKASS